MKKQKAPKTQEEKLMEEKEKAIEIARQLGYFKINPNLREEIYEAKTPIAVDRILRTCRRAS